MVQNPVIKDNFQLSYFLTFLNVSLLLLLYRKEVEKPLVSSTFLTSMVEPVPLVTFCNEKTELLDKFSLSENKQMGGEAIMLNYDSGFTCAICGRHEDVPSLVTLQANYGSQQHDGERYTLHLCGGCIDCWIDAVRQHIPPDRLQFEQLF